jgi:hypothetical protein
MICLEKSVWDFELELHAIVQYPVKSLVLNQSLIPAPCRRKALLGLNHGRSRFGFFRCAGCEALFHWKGI